MEVTIGQKLNKACSEQVKGQFPDKFGTMNCPITDVLDRVSDKWSIHAIIMLGRSEKLRFNELMKGIHGISQRMLTVTLRSLEEDGLVTRKVYAQIPPKVEYQLTDLGRSLLWQLMKLSQWATENMGQIFESRKKYQTEKV